MVIVGGPDKAVVGNIHKLPKVEDAAFSRHDFVHKLLGRDAGGLCLFLDFLAVLVGAGEKHHVVALHALVARHGVGGHGAVGVTDMELVRGVIDGGCDIERSILIH